MTSPKNSAFRRRLGPRRRTLSAIFLTGMFIGIGLELGPVGIQPAGAQEEAAPATGLSEGMRLATPRVAAQLELNEEQRGTIAGLVTERAEALAAAGQDLDRRREVQMEYEQKLLGVLTAEQRAQWDEMAAEPRLSFQFRLQKWSEVLDWFAEQSGLSLVMDAPPTGSFNYTDTRQYTPTEAIDLLNSVLLSKGYTLIRRDQMLIVLDLTEGIPEGLVPRVAPSELEKRGRFELVSVLIPLEGRTPDDVVAEVTPLLGPHGTAVALPKTGQLLVTDTAGVVRAVSSIIDSIPKPSRPPERQPEPSPELTVYPLEGLEPDAVLEILQSLLSNVKFVVDRQAEQLNAYARPKEHATIESILRRMKAGDPVDRRPQMEVYGVQGADMASLVENLKVVVPTMRFAVDERASRLIAWGTPREHELIHEVIKQLVSTELGPDAPSLRAYDPLSDLDLVTTVLSRLIPSAQIISPAGSEQMLILASEKDHQIVAETLPRLGELSRPEDQRRRLKIYPVTPAQRTRFLAVLDTLSSEMGDLKVITDAEPGELSVWARPAQHEVVEQLLGELAVESPDGPRYALRVFPLQHVDVTTAQTTLSTLLPGTQLIPETAGRRLLAWATPDTHEQIAQALTEIDVAPPGRNEVLEVHRVPRSDLSTLVTVIQPLAPEARLATDFGSSSLLVWGTPEEQERLRKAVDSVVQAARGGQREVRRFELQHLTPDAAVSIVQSLVRRATTSPGPDGNSIVVWAEPDELETVAGALREVDSRSENGSRRLVAYPMPASKLEAFMQVADPNMVRRMQLTADTTHRSLLARGTPEEHAELKELLEQFVEQLPEADIVTAIVYPLQNADARAAYRALSNVVPNARLSMDDVGNQLLATTTEDEHGIIRALVEQMDQDPAVSNRAVLRSYPIRAGDPASVYSALTDLFRRQRDVDISLDQSSGTLLVHATPHQHEEIEKFLGELQRNGVESQEARVQLYPLGEADGTEIVTTLNTLFAAQAGRVRISHDRGGNRLIVVAPPEQQKVVQDLMDQLPQQRRGVEAIALQRVDVQSASQAINRLFGNLNYSQSPTVDTDIGSQQLFIRGTPEQIEQIQELLAKMGESSVGISGSPFLPSDTGAADGLRIVPFRGDTRTAIEQLRRIWPRMRANDLRILEPESLLPENVPPSDTPSEPSPDEGAAAPVGDWHLVSTESPVPIAPKPADGGQPGDEQNELARPAAREVTESETEPRPPVPSGEKTSSEEPSQETERRADPEPVSPVDVPRSLEPPVILVPGDGSITIASDDPEAVQQAESILRALAGESEQRSRTTKVGNQLMIYPLRFAGAEGVAESIDQLVRGLGSRGRGFLSSGPFSGNVVAVADTRLNAVVVFANRADQPQVEQLLQVLDAPESPESLVAHRPKLIPLKFAKVERVENVIRSVYRTQMQSGAGRSSINIPTGISADLAAALQQAYATRSGPLLTVSSDPVSNTLIVMAPQNLVEEVEQLVAELDDADRNDPARSLQVLELEKVSSERIRDALDILLDGGNQGRTTRTRRR